MADYRIVEVKTKKDLNRFISFPDKLYKDCPQYVPALHSDQRKSLTKVASLKYCTRVMWLAMDGKKVVFGWFDTINDIEVARLLLGTAEKWAKAQGMNEIHGPLYYNTLGKQGMLVEGFENLAPFNCIYNYPYYNDLVTSLGYVKECDWLQYKMKADQGVPPKMAAIAERLQERYSLTVGDIDSLKHDKALVREFFRIYNESFAESVYNFVPFTDEEIEEAYPRRCRRQRVRCSRSAGFIS